MRTAEYTRNLRAHRLKRGLCSDCNEPTDGGYYCARHAELHRKYGRRSRENRCAMRFAEDLLRVVNVAERHRCRPEKVWGPFWCHISTYRISGSNWGSILREVKKHRHLVFPETLFVVKGVFLVKEEGAPVMIVASRQKPRKNCGGGDYITFPFSLEHWNGTVAAF